MGYLHYGSKHVYEFDDRTLAHLRSIITTKLSLRESFVFTWSDEKRQNSIWLHPALDLAFEFTGPETPELNRARLEALMKQANSVSGLVLRLAPDHE